MTGQRRDRLGKGLGALLGDYLEPSGQVPDAGALAVDAISPNPHQPRKEFSDEELVELSESIRANGLLQPLVVRPDPSTEGRFELVAGERRLRAVQRLGWTEVPALVRDVDDETLLVLALVENLQREALNPLEEAEGYRALSEDFGMTQAEIAGAVGKKRSTVANLLRLLKLPPSVRRMVRAGDLSMGHARALLALDAPVRMSELAKTIVREGLSVREVERRVSGTPAEKPRAKAGPRRDPVEWALEEALRERLAARASLRGVKRGKGTIQIPFTSPADFERLFALITGKEASEVVDG